ncbi:hypothetical protein [Gracilibacillus suaedae]|uniref:hypothetical protein n=1 Tax=Gracilibacillus suaedae TaxID=2820273 RepID=UPI001ABDE406|nr:hypothetical protein [Gracilibacillus suaedae]
MYEEVGRCAECDETIYCKDGFLDGVHHNGKVYCWQCDHISNMQKLENEEE